jgi:dGTPase
MNRGLDVGRPGTIREERERMEEILLSPRASFSKRTRGRIHPEEECPIRTAFARDRDRIIHSKAFRRLKHKTQVFIAPMGDHYRTRLTHTIEVSQIARTIARALRLNEDLTEAIALGHDLGHTPFGHAGEEILNELLPGGFRHPEQSLRVVDLIEKDGRGLNLTFEVRDGILNHSGKSLETLLGTDISKPLTLEGEVARISDLIAYVNHDVDDAIRAGIIDGIPRALEEVLGRRNSERINTMVVDIVETSQDLTGIRMSERIAYATEELKEYLYENVYTKEPIRKEVDKCKKILEELFHLFVRRPELITADNIPSIPGEPMERMVADFIAGMTDRYAITIYTRFFVPSPWMSF